MGVGAAIMRSLEGGATGNITEVQEQTVTLYYYDPSRDLDAEGNILCSRGGLVPVRRTTSGGEDIIDKTIRLLLSGILTEEERASGVTTEFPLPGFSLKEVRREGETLTLVFDDPNHQTTGGSCRTGILWFQIEATARGFDAFRTIRFEPDELFQP